MVTDCQFGSFDFTIDGVWCFRTTKLLSWWPVREQKQINDER